MQILFKHFSSPLIKVNKTQNCIFLKIKKMDISQILKKSLMYDVGTT